ncbi:MAG: hypothetical protein U0359_37735 [Byssovorax sp.]
MRRSLGLLLLPLLVLACEPGTCNPPPPPEENKPCVDGPDWGVCSADGSSALVCLHSTWTRVSCKARPCQQALGQPTFAGRYWLACGTDPAAAGQACSRPGEVTVSRDDPKVTLSCKGGTFQVMPAASTTKP